MSEERENPQDHFVADAAEVARGAPSSTPSWPPRSPPRVLAADVIAVAPSSRATSACAGIAHHAPRLSPSLSSATAADVARGAPSSPPSPRVFAPDSAMWRVVRHRAILLHGPAAAVLQVAHPRIGLGVMEHSDFAADPTARLHRTLDAVYAIAFGTREQADRAARVVAARHAKVVGDAAAHDVPGPPRYSTGERDLLLWVIATLVWSAVSGYERAVGPLSRDDRERFYRDMRTLGTFFNLPATVGPQDWASFERYFAEQLVDELLGSHAVSRRVAWAVARPTTPWWLRLARVPITFIFSEILPPPVRDRLGFRSTVFSRASLRIATIALRAFDRLAPDALRFHPQYRHARAAMRAMHGETADALDWPVAGGAS